MRVESPAKYPVISTVRSAQLHPHQSIFYDQQKILDEIDTDPVKKRKNNEALGLPELYSMQFNKKIYNTRLSNYQENLGRLVKGITKDINEMSELVVGLKKYGTQINFEAQREAMEKDIKKTKKGE